MMQHESVTAMATHTPRRPIADASYRASGQDRQDPPSAPSALDLRWQPLAARDTRADGTFVYGVTSTGVYCRPSCPSRRPRADRVRFFDSTDAARQAGFRACKRCRPDQLGTAQPGVEAVRRVAAFLAGHADRAITLAHLGKLAAMSPHHLQRRFKAIVGLSPREYQAAVRAGRLRTELRDGRDVTTAILEAGYGSPSRVYESAPTGRGLTPSAYRRGGAGQRIAYSVVKVALGQLLVAETALGVCSVQLGDDPSALEQGLRREYPAADIHATTGARTAAVRAIVEHLKGEPLADLPIDVKATAFQWKVWRALQRIPLGETRAYGEVAASIGAPTAARAVARACATNPVCLVVPCHRVVPADGTTGGYRWGAERKKRLLAAERRHVI